MCHGEEKKADIQTGVDGLVQETAKPLSRHLLLRYILVSFLHAT